MNDQETENPSEEVEVNPEEAMLYTEEDEDSVEEKEVIQVDNQNEFGQQVEILKSCLAGEKEITHEDFDRAKKVCDGILLKKIRFNYAQLDNAVETINVDISDVCEANYSKKLKEVAGYRDYFIEQLGRVKAFVKWHDRIIDLLSAYVIYLSTKKKDMHKHEAMVRLQKYYLQKEQYDDLHTRLDAKKSAYEKKYDAISRLLSYWEQQAKVGFTRNSPNGPNDR